MIARVRSTDVGGTTTGRTPSESPNRANPPRRERSRSSYRIAPNYQGWWNDRKELYPHLAVTRKGPAKPRPDDPAIRKITDKYSSVILEDRDGRLWGFETRAHRDAFVMLYDGEKVD